MSRFSPPFPSPRSFSKRLHEKFAANVSIVDSTWFVPPPSREKIWREELCLGLVQNESKANRLISICTKPRKNFSRQILSLDKPSALMVGVILFKKICTRPPCRQGPVPAGGIAHHRAERGRDFGRATGLSSHQHALCRVSRVRAA